MWDWQQIVSVAVVLAVGVWLLVSIARNPSLMRRVPRNDAAVRDEFNQAVRDAASRPPDRPKPPQRSRVAGGTAVAGCFGVLLALVAVVGIVWAAFAFHPALGVAAIAIALLMLMASG